MLDNTAATCYNTISNNRLWLINIGRLEGESMKMGFDGLIKVEFYGAKLSSNGVSHIVTLITHLDCLIQFHRLLSINVQVIISNMLCPLYCINRYTAVSMW